MKSLVVLSLLALISEFMAAQDMQPTLEERARAGDSSAISQMAQSGNVKGLSSLLHDPDYQAKQSVRLLLAKLGDQESLQYYACRSLTNNLLAMEDLERQYLDYIGGEFSVKIYRRLLDSDQQFLNNLDPVLRGSDVVVVPGGVGIIFKLQSLLPTAPLPRLSPVQLQANPKEVDDIKSGWRLWIDGHQSEIRNSKPTSEGISFDPKYCSSVFDETAFERKLKEVSGSGAIDCGGQWAAQNRLAAVEACLAKQAKLKHPFFARESLELTFVPSVAVGFAGDNTGNVFALAYDDAGVSKAGLGDSAKISNNGHIVSVLCQKPLELVRSQSGWITCVTSAGNPLLSPR